MICKLLVCVICVIISGISAAFSGPTSTVVLLNGNATLTCSSSNYTNLSDGPSLWNDATDGGNIITFATQTGGVFTSPAFAKYSNFEIVSAVASQMDLRVRHAQVEDEGTYTCAMITDSGSARLTVESRFGVYSKLDKM